MSVHQRKGHHARTYMRNGAGAFNSAPVDTRPRATPITPSWLCDCETWNAPQRDHCTNCQSDKPTDAA